MRRKPDMCVTLTGHLQIWVTHCCWWFITEFPLSSNIQMPMKSLDVEELSLQTSSPSVSLSVTLSQKNHQCNLVGILLHYCRFLRTFRKNLIDHVKDHNFFQGTKWYWSTPSIPRVLAFVFVASVCEPAVPSCGSYWGVPKKCRKKSDIQSFLLDDAWNPTPPEVLVDWLLFSDLTVKTTYKGWGLDVTSCIFWSR